jgi:excisionase family DNA binding protein
LVLTIPEAAALLRVSERSVRLAIRRGELPGFRIGRRLLVPREKLEAMLASAEPVRPVRPTQA